MSLDDSLCLCLSIFVSNVLIFSKCLSQCLSFCVSLQTEVCISLFLVQSNLLCVNFCLSVCLHLSPPNLYISYLISISIFDTFLCMVVNVSLAMLIFLCGFTLPVVWFCHNYLCVSMCASLSASIYLSRCFSLFVSLCACSFFVIVQFVLACFCLVLYVSLNICQCRPLSIFFCLSFCLSCLVLLSHMFGVSVCPFFQEFTLSISFCLCLFRTYSFSVCLLE